MVNLTYSSISLEPTQILMKNPRDNGGAIILTSYSFLYLSELYKVIVLPVIDPIISLLMYIGFS